VRDLVNVTKRYQIAAAAHYLGRILRRLTGIGKPKALQGGDGVHCPDVVCVIVRALGLAHFVKMTESSAGLRGLQGRRPAKGT
jgi:hypothetical protein